MILLSQRFVYSLIVLITMDGCDESANPDDEDYGDTETMLMGELGELGPIEPTVASVMIENSGETLVYMSSVSLTCAQLMVSRWLGGLMKGAQVIEIVVPSDQANGEISIGQGEAEVNFAEGGKSSAYEIAAKSGLVTFTKSEPGQLVEGNVSATYADPKTTVKGRFHATFCAGGQGY